MAKKCASDFYVHALYRMTHEHVLSVRNHNKKIRHNAKFSSNLKLEYLSKSRMKEIFLTN